MSKQPDKAEMIERLLKLREESYAKGFQDALESIESAISALEVLGLCTTKEEKSLVVVILGIISMFQEEFYVLREQAKNSVPPDENIH